MTSGLRWGARGEGGALRGVGQTDPLVPQTLTLRPVLRAGPTLAAVGDNTTAGDAPWTPFRRTQTEECSGSWQGSTVVADQGALYHVGAAQLHAVKVTIEAASTVRGFEYWCYSPGSGAGGGGGQDLGTVAVGLYTNDPAAGVEGPSGLIAQATSPNGRCTPGWNVLEPDEPTDAITPGDYWLVLVHENDWRTSYSPGTSLVKSASAFALDQTLSGFSLYDSHPPSSAVPIAVQMCDMSQSLACMRPCFDIVPEPDWTDRDESCFWLVRMVYREPVAGVSQNACMDQCDDTILADARRDLARCQEGYHGL